MPADQEHALAARFAALTAEGRRRFLEGLHARGLDFGELPIVSAPGDALAASAAQSRQWFLWQLDPHSSAYHISYSLRLTGVLDVDAVRWSFGQLADRHQSLRTTFRMSSDGSLELAIEPSSRFEFSMLDASAAPDDVADAQAAAEVRRISQAAFDLTTGPLFRVGLIRLVEEKHVLVVVMHHIVSDGWSMQIIVDEFVELYRARIEGREPNIQPLPIQYADYALWQRNWLEAGEQDRQRAYWRQQLGEEHPVLELPTDHPRQAEPNYRAARHSFELPTSLVEGLRRRAHEHQSTLFVVLLAAFQALLYRYSGQQDVRVGTTNANRHRPETQPVVGLFVNTQVLRGRVHGRMTLGSLLAQLREVVLGAQAHQDLPFEQLVTFLNPERSVSRSPLFQVVMNHQRRDYRALRQLPGLSLHPYGESDQAAQFDLTLDTEEHPDGRLSVSLTYAAELFESQTIQRMGSHYRRVLHAIADRPGQRVGEIDLLELPELESLHRWGAPIQDRSSAVSVHRWIERQAQRDPASTALICGAGTMTYGELNARANRLAHALIAHGVKPESRVGLAVERSVDLVVAVLGILKAGGAYVPLDPMYPADRLAHMMEDSGITLLLTQTSVAARLPAMAGVRPLQIDTLNLSDEPGHDPDVRLHPDNLAYVIYTSGSTGKPKGAQLSHRNVSRLLAATHEWFHFNERDVWTLFHSYAFDFSVWEMFGALCYGGKLVIVPYEVSRSPEEFLSLLRREQVTVLNQTPSAFKQLLQLPSLYTDDDLSLRAVIFGGEALDPQSLRPWLEHFGDVKPRLINMYGITETTVHVTYRPITKADLDTPRSPIGEHIPDLGMRVLDADLNAAPIGVPGELYVAGDGLARGYLNRAGWSAERFIADPASAHGERLYRTGDEVRWSGDGQLDYLGRIDRQVKIRGFRIELGEIEAHLLAQPEVREAVVVMRDGPTGPRLAAYVVAAEIETSLLRERLARVLPDYMVPTHFAVLDCLPLTVNGKLDRKALPEPEHVGTTQYEAPHGEIEETLAAIWAEVLHVERVGRHDNFFQLGGDSLLSLRVIARARDRSMVLTPKQLFAHQTLSALAQQLSAKSQQAAIPIADRNGPLPLSPAQSRQWFLWQLDPHSTAYHTGSALRLTGRLDIDGLRSAFASLVTRHASLRTVFRPSSDGVAEQLIQDLESFELLERDVSGESRDIAETKAAEAARQIARTPFDLTAGPLLRVGLIRVAAEEHVLVVVMHHIVCDGWSMQIIETEFVELYRSRLERRNANLQPLPIQYVDYAVWQRQWLEAGEQERQLTYWKTQLGEEHPVLQLPTDHARLAEPKYRAAHYSFEVPAGLSQALQRQARVHRATLFTVLLTGLQALLHRYTGLPDIRIGTNNANRHRPEIHAVVGFFINAQVIRGRLDGRMSLATLLTQIRDAVAGMQEHQDLPFEQLVDALQPERSLHHPPLFQVLMNHQRQARREPEQLPGLALQTYELGEQAAKFELMLSTLERADGRVDASFTFAAELFEPETIARFADHYLKMLAALAGQPQQRMCDVDLPSHGAVLEHQRALPPETADQLVEHLGERHPDAVALVVAGKQLTYAELNRRATQLAYQLMSLGIERETRVGVHASRSIEFVVALLAVWRAGGVYVPLDPQLPAERLAHQLKDSGAQVLLSAGTAPWVTPVTVIDLTSVDAFINSQQATAQPLPAIHPSQSAYVIYTSGSTGQPKGVVVSHGALANYVQGVLGTLALPEDAQHFAMVSTVAADLGHTVLFGALCSGRTLHLISPECAFDPDRFAAYMHEHRVHVLKVVPSHLQGLLSASRPQRVLPLHTLILGGEATSWPLLARIRELAPNCRVINHYGPTETTVGTLTHDAACTRLDAAATLPIGTPLPNTQACVLDADLNTTPEGVFGELYIGGAGLARGYQNRSGFTAERFVANPFKRGDRMYRTGDRVRVLKDRTIEFMGRVDDQVKVRGYRVELREIANTLKSQPEVREAEVIARLTEDGHVQLHGYVVPETLDPPTLQDRLAALLPEYMVPSAIIALKSLPLTANGKLDRKALPEPGRKEHRYEAPQGEIEPALATIWAKVLRLERIGRHDNFFQLGGDSIHCLQIVARSRSAGWLITLDQMFECQTLARLSAVAEAVQAPAEVQTAALPTPQFEGLPVPAELIEDVYPMTAMQQGMLLHTLQNPRSGMYVIQSQYQLDTEIDVAAFEKAWSQVVQRHAALRTAFLARSDGSLVQVVHKQVPSPVEYLDWSDLPPEESTQRVARLLAEEVERGFDLAEPRSFRVRLIRTGARRFEATQSCHHILLDAWCWSLIRVDFFAYYNAYRSGSSVVLPPPRPYRDFVMWLERQDPEKARAYWRAVLRGFDAPTPLPMKERPANAISSMVDVATLLSEATTRRLHLFAQEHQITVNTVVQGCWALLLSKYSDRRNVLFGVTVAGRPAELAGIQESVGLFVNTIPLRVAMPERDDRTTVVAWLKELLAQNIAMRAHEHLPLPDIQRLSDIPQGLSLFDSLFVFENAPFDVSLDGHAQDISAHRTRSRTHTNYPITVMIVPATCLELHVIYERSLFDRSLVTAMAEHFRALVEQCMDRPTAPLHDLHMIPMAQLEEIVLAGRGREAGADIAGSYAGLFEAQVRRTPTATAVRFGTDSFHYDELNRRANGLARVLRSQGVREDDLVVVFADRDLDLPCQILGIFKAGAAYLALDPGLPSRRLGRTLNSCGARLILTTRAHADFLSELLPQLKDAPSVLIYENAARSLIDDTNIGIHPPADGAAYAIYTSGSTGEPKGVLITSQGMLNNQLSKVPALGLTPKDVIAQTAASSFDISVWQLLAGLLCGATVEIVPDAIAQDPRRLLDHIATAEITVLESVPSLIQGMLLGEAVPLPSLRYMISTGERMPGTLARRWMQRYPATALLNAYGPAECADDVTIHRTEPADLEQGSSLAIGRVVDNTQLYVLDQSCDLLPEGAIGELYVGGAGLGRGYIGQSGHTAERFVADPFAGGLASRMYRTGDLVRRRGDGVLEYHGRVDQQIKIRGFRVEIGEIEAQLAGMAGVQQSAVGVHADAAGDPRLVGYVVSNDSRLSNATPETRADYWRVLRQTLQESLPDYMVPTAWMLLESLPRTASGKLDRNKLPKPDPAQMQRSYEPPTGELEELIAAIWKELLKVERVGRGDNFFELGGHSLLVMKAAAQLQAATGMTVPITDVFETQTLERLATRIAANPRVAPGRVLEDVDAFLSTLETV